MFFSKVCGGVGHSYRMSGVTPICINSPEESRKWQALSVPAVYRVTFELGKRTDTLFADGKTIEKSTYKHLERKETEVVNLLQRTQRNHQKMLFRHANVPLQSQAAYELAVKGTKAAFFGLKNSVLFQNSTNPLLPLTQYYWNLVGSL